MLTELGQRIKDSRLKLSMSQSKLAELTGYKDKTAIAHIEAGRIDLPQSKLIAIADALNVSVSYLIDGDASEEPQSSALMELMRIASLCPEADVKMATDMLKRMHAYQERL